MQLFCHHQLSLDCWLSILLVREYEDKSDKNTQKQQVYFSVHAVMFIYMCCGKVLAQYFGVEAASVPPVTVYNLWFVCVCTLLILYTCVHVYVEQFICV